MKTVIFPSLLAAEQESLPFIVDELISFGVKCVHFDVMDKKFIGHTALKINDFKKIKNKKIKYDIHLMVSNPREYSKKFIDLGAKMITFHYEAFKNKMSIVNFINNLHLSDVKVGIAFKPDTDIKDLLFFIKMVDVVLIMSVEPGKCGQAFKKKILRKIKICSEYIKQQELKTLIEVDGGINEKTSLECCQNGANILVVGSYLFKDKAEIKKRFKKMFDECNKVIRI